MLTDAEISALYVFLGRSALRRQRALLAGEVARARSAARSALGFLETFAKYVLMGERNRWVDRPIHALRALLPETPREAAQDRRVEQAERELRASWDKEQRRAADALAHLKSRPLRKLLRRKRKSKK